MRFIGVDLAWSEKNWTGVALVEDGRVVESAVIRPTVDIVDWLTPLTREPCVVAIDAPLIVPNRSGRRPCEAAISHCFQQFEAGAYPSNLGLAAFKQGIRGHIIADQLGLNLDPSFQPLDPQVRRAIEVYPHPAMVALFELEKTLKYKFNRARALASPDARREAFEGLTSHLESLRSFDPSLDVSTSPRWLELRNGITTETSNGVLNRFEDELDAYTCAYIGLYFWTHGTNRCRIVGDVSSGYIVTPVTDRQGACLDEWSALRRPLGHERHDDSAAFTAHEQLAGGTYILNTDGGKASTGTAAIGVVLRDSDEHLVDQISMTIGDVSNTEAEYRALIEGLKLAQHHPIARIRIFMDSESIVDQLNDGVPPREENVSLLYATARRLLEGFPNRRLSWIPRERNRDADDLVQLAFAKEQPAPGVLERDVVDEAQWSPRT